MAGLAHHALIAYCSGALAAHPRISRVSRAGIALAHDRPWCDRTPATSRGPRRRAWSTRSSAIISPDSAPMPPACLTGNPCRGPRGGVSGLSAVRIPRRRRPRGFRMPPHSPLPRLQPGASRHTQATVSFLVTTREPAASNHIRPSATMSNFTMYSPGESGAGQSNESATTAPGDTSFGSGTR